VVRVEWRTPVLLTTRCKIKKRLSRLDPRDCDFHVYEVADEARAGPVLRRLSAERRLVAAAAAGPVLSSAIRISFGDDREAWAVSRYFRDCFPPEGSIPHIPLDLLPAVRGIAQGGPGDTVPYGLFPSRPTKLARLALARQGEYPADVVLHAARHAYDQNRSYQAHDAFACALVHPDVDATELAERYARQLLDRDGGRRSRRKTNHLLAWARRHGHLPDPPVRP
jgi:hypothetical protein